MKSSLTILLSGLLSLSAFAMPTSVDENYELLSQRNKAKADKGQIASVKLLKKEDAILVKPGRVSQGTTTTVQQPVVNINSCFAELVVENVYYDTATTSGGCGGEPYTYEYIDYANVSVDIDFETFGFDHTNVQVILYATDKITGDYYQIGEEDFVYQSDAFGDVLMSVVFVVDGSYAKDYYISADVFLDDEYGQACSLMTNEEVIY